jgi:hypothetical protein
VTVRVRVRVRVLLLVLVLAELVPVLVVGSVATRPALA